LNEKFLQILLRDLRVLETSLLCDDQQENKRTSFLLIEIKRAVDNVRTSLWCRMQAASGHNVESAMLVEQHRLQRAVDLLRSPAVGRTTAMQR
jgi:ribosome-interacting GTPase 1